MLNKKDKAIVRELQSDLPLVSRPFKQIAKKLGIDEERLLTKINEMLKTGKMRRMGAALRHQKVGYTANAMVVWEVPEKEIDRIGGIMADFDEVTHCYKRVSKPEWPYNLYTVIHGFSREECRHIVKKISKITGINKYKILFSTNELKKSSMKYFENEDKQ